MSIEHINMADTEVAKPEQITEHTEIGPEINVALYEVAPKQPIVQIFDGRIRGTHVKTVNDETLYFSFLGIPYAKPPVGQLRFCPPEPPDPWNYRRNALKESNMCLQYDPRFETFQGDEDCLYLNVFTPRLPGCCSKLCGGPCSTLLPVMVYIHGGDFTRGSGASVDILGPEYLVNHKVVLVTINYRLNILGFLSLDRHEAPGNMGLKDQVMALQWVKANIANFQGDPKNITIFGSDAGAASVTYHLISPMSKGLFHKAIAQSGSALQHWAFNRDIKSLAFKIAEINGKDVQDNENQLYTYLMSLKSKDLVKSAALVVESMKHKGGVYFGFVPTVEIPGKWKTFLTTSPYELFEAGKFRKVPFVTGFCSGEGLAATTPGKRIIPGMLADKNLVKRLPFNTIDTDVSELKARLNDIYLPAVQKRESNPYLLEQIEPEERTSPEDFAITFLSDVDYVAGIVVLTSLIAKHMNKRVYLYEFTYDGNMNIAKQKLATKRPGTVHGDELGYLFKRKKEIIPEDTLGCCDRRLRERWSQMWTYFARYGNPTPKRDATVPYKWLPVSDAENMEYLEIGNYFTICENPYPERMGIFYDLYSTFRETDSYVHKPPVISEKNSKEYSEHSRQTHLQVDEKNK